MKKQAETLLWLQLTWKCEMLTSSLQLCVKKKNEGANARMIYRNSEQGDKTLFRFSSTWSGALRITKFKNKKKWKPLKEILWKCKNSNQNIFIYSLAKVRRSRKSCCFPCCVVSMSCFLFQTHHHLILLQPVIHRPQCWLPWHLSLPRLVAALP